jgi:hypothetical protein
MNQFKCEYMGCMIEKLALGGIKFWQKVLLLSYRDDFEIKSVKKFNTPAASGTFIKKPVEGNVILTPAKQMLYCSGVGKGVHMMQYLQPDTYNAI